LPVARNEARGRGTAAHNLDPINSSRSAKRELEPTPCFAKSARVEPGEDSRPLADKMAVGKTTTFRKTPSSSILSRHRTILAAGRGLTH
jgi:hypothetical protein